MPTTDDDHVFAGHYLLYEMHLSPKLSGGWHRCYWQGPGSHTWGSGEDAKASAPRFTTAAAARAALVEDEGEDRRGSLGRLGYEWIPPVIEQLHLMPVPEQLHLFPEPEAQP